MIAMRCGMFGKLPSKRDFVAIGAPRAFLRLWEPWLEAGLRQGRTGAEEEWIAAYNTAPIWRFWLGPALCGEALAGAFMPSVDAVGRMFPLTVICASFGGDPLEPPDVDPREACFARVEGLLLDALDPDAPFETIVARLDGLCADAASPEQDASAPTFAAMRSERPDCPPEAATFWWTVGGADWPPLAMMQNSMPSPETFADMLSRRQNRHDDVEQMIRPQAIVQPG